MTDPDALNVWNNQLLVGHLWRNATAAIGFRYAPQWIAPGGFSVSHTLPLGNDDFTPEDRALPTVSLPTCCQKAVSVNRLFAT